MLAEYACVHVQTGGPQHKVLPCHPHDYAVCGLRAIVEQSFSHFVDLSSWCPPSLAAKRRDLRPENRNPHNLRGYNPKPQPTRLTRLHASRCVRTRLETEAQLTEKTALIEMLNDICVGQVGDGL